MVRLPERRIECNAWRDRELVAGNGSLLSGTNAPRTKHSSERFESVAALQLPTENSRALPSAARWEVIRHELDADLLAAVRQTSVETGAPLDEVLLAGWKIVLARWTDQDDVAVLLRRRSSQADTCEGCDASVREMLWLVRSDLSQPCTFTEVVAHVHLAVIDAIVNATHWEEGLPSIQALFDATFTDDRVSASAADRAGQLAVDCGAEVALTIRHSRDLGFAQLHFRADLFDRLALERMLDHYCRLLKRVLAVPHVPTVSLPLVLEDERRQLLEQLNDTARPYPDAQRVHELFAEQVRRTPQSVALIHDGKEMTYDALNQEANRLARYLRELRVGPDVIVGICLERSAKMVIAVLAVLKAGGAYLPLDPAFPRNRLAFMLTESSAAVVLTQRALLAILPGEIAKRVCLDTDWHLVAECDAQDLIVAGSPEDLAYVIYTSGSTGTPKGVMISHRAAVNFLTSMLQIPCVTVHDRFLAVTTLSFDPALFELISPLVTGATVVLAGSDECIDPSRLCEMLDEFAVTVMSAATTTWGQMVATGWHGRRELRAVVGGAALPAKLAQDLLARCAEVWNQYGPTETTVTATCWRVSHPELGIFIGTPIANTRCLILDRHLQLTPLGAYGELYIGGLGLARGYLNRQELTASRFIADPYLPGARLYRTGDLVRWHRSGLLEFAGRIDHQVKLRGFRIELGEIEAELDACEGVQGSVAVIREDRPGDQRLVAYIVGDVANVRGLKRHLGSRLPGYMLPSAIVRLDAFPLTPNGKVDRKALPMPASTAWVSEAIASELATMDSLQRSLAAEWEDVLNVRPVGLNDDFFDLGGHSLLALSLLGRIALRFGQRLSLGSFLAAPTVRTQAELLRDGLSALGARSLVPICAAGTRPPLFFASGWGGPILSLRALAEALGSEQPLYLLDYLAARAADHTSPTIEHIASALIAEMQSLRPTGPYHLAGFSLGANIVYEMAQQLRAAGESVPVLILLDGYAPGHPILPPFHVRTMLHVQQALRLGPWRMWPYLLKYTIRLRRFVAEIQPKLYEGVTDEHASPMVAELTRGALSIYHASQKYRVIRYPGRLMVITAEDLSEFGIGASAGDPTAGWRNWAEDAIYVGSLPGIHRNLLSVEHAAKLAELFDDCFRLGAN
jgi:amino acid adenylation domain-containing protein